MSYQSAHSTSNLASRYHDNAPYTDSQAVPPSRPERRRPVGSTPSPASMNDGRFPATYGQSDNQQYRRPSTASSFSGRTHGASSRHPQQPTSRDGSNARNHGLTVDTISESSAREGNGGYATSKSRRMMDQLNMNHGSGGASGDLQTPLSASSPRMPHSPLFPSAATRETDRPRRSSSVGSFEADGAQPRVDEDGETVDGTEEGGDEDTDMVPTTALNDAISAFSAAGSRRDGRRGGLADQGYTAQAKVKQARASALNPEAYPDTPAFREIDAALKRVAAEWPVLTYGTSLSGSANTTNTAAVASEREFDPVSLALGLLDPSSADGGSRSLDAFLDMKAQLDHAIESTLSSSSSSYRAYESSISTHNSTLQTLGASQRTVAELKTQLADAREKLDGKGKDGLLGMYNRMHHLEEMGKLLDEIDHFRSIPDRLEALLSEKRFLSAVVLIVRSLKTIKKPEMMEIGALTDLRSWLVLQESVLLEILVEELHNHLYLKSFYCDVRWKSYTRGQAELPQVDFGDDVETSETPSHLEPSFHTSGRSTARLPRLSKLQRYLNYLTLRPSSNPLVDEPIDDLQNNGSGVDDSGGIAADGGSFSLPNSTGSESAGSLDASSGPDQRSTSRNPELDSFSYIESLMESLAVLGKLGYGLDAITQRVQGEMFTLIENTVEEVEERNDLSKQSTTFSTALPPSSFLLSNGSTGDNRGSLASLSSLTFSGSSNNRSSVLRLTATETAAAEQSVETLKDLFWTLYSKLDAVLQGFRVSYEVAIRIAERRDFKDAAGVKSSSGNLLFSLLDIWKPIQQEVRTLLHDYIADDQSGVTSARNPIVSINEVLRLNRPRDNSKQMFRFGDSDYKASNKVLKAHEEELYKALRHAVPGLLTDASATLSALSVNSSGRSGAGGAGSGIGASHKPLVRADAFNVSILFGPTLAFLDRVKEVMPAGLLGDEDSASTGFSGFLDEFVLKTFLPQLEDKVSTVFHQAAGGIDAFQEDPGYRKVSRVPLVKSVVNLMTLISSLSSMLRSTPFHRESYSHLIVSVVHQYFQRCRDRFKDLITGDGPAPSAPSTGDKVPVKLSAAWSEASDINACLLELWESDPDDQDKLRTLLERETKIEVDKKRSHIVKPEDLISPSKKLLALGTLYSSLEWFMRRIASLSSDAADLEDIDTGLLPQALTAATPRLGTEDKTQEPVSDMKLPLTNDMSKAFEALVSSYRQLSHLVLFTMRLEVRLRTMHHLDRATRSGVYQLAEDVAEPDPSVVELNSSLAEIDDCAATTLDVPARRFIFEGLSLLMDQLLIHNARHIRLANKHGMSKMMRNILALQQNLKNIGDGETPLEVEVNFDRSRTYWETFGKGPKKMLDLIRAGAISYDFEDYKSLLNLMCGIDQSSKDANGAPGTSNDATAPLSATTDKPRRMYNEYLIDLFALDVGDGEE